MNALGMPLLWDTIEEHINVPLWEHGNRATSKEDKDSGKV